MRSKLLLFISLLPVAAWAAPAADSFLPVAVWYGGGKARAPMLEAVTPKSAEVWRKDLAQIKALGFNTVRTWVEWSAGEPRQGEYHLEALDLMLRLAEEAGLKVMVQTYVDSAPDWVGVKYRDGLLVAQNGQGVPSQAAPGYCFDHPGVRKETLGFLEEVAHHVSKSKAFYGWDLWSEPHIINWAEINYIPRATFCYCPNTLARFRTWLKKKYGGLPQLNTAWYRQFQDWSQVEPPRFDTILSYTDYMDWRVFVTEKIAEDLHVRHEMIKKVTPGAVTTSHAGAPSVLGSLASGEGNPDDYKMYKSVDYYGTSLYPKHSLPPHMAPMRIRMAVDLTRSAGLDRGFYIGELQAGFGVRGDIVSEEVTPQDVVRYMWTSVSRGARGINVYAYYPMNAGYESGGYGLVDLDGALTERSKAAGAAARQIGGNADLLARAHPKPAQVAIVVNQLTNLIGGEGHLYRRDALSRSLSGYYRMFSERNIAVDFVNAVELTAEQARKYKLIVLPYPLLMLSNEAQALEQYVRDGGHLFTEARAGWVDERGYAQPVIPGFGWEKMTGVRELATAPKPNVKVKWGDWVIPASIFEERFTVLDASAKVLGTFEDGSPAVYERAAGKGSIILAGTFFGYANASAEALAVARSNIIVGSEAEKRVAMHPLAGMLAQWAGVEEPKLTSDVPLDLRQLEADGGTMLFLMNWEDREATAELAIAPSRSVSEITTGEKLPAGSRIATKVPARGVRVFRVDY